MSSTTIDASTTGERRPLRWETFSARDAHLHEGAVDEVLTRRRDGVTVTGIYEPEEIDRALAHFEDPRTPKLDHTFGALIGMSLGMVGEEPDRSRYLDDTAQAMEIYEEAFGFDPFERLADRIRPLAGGRDLAPPYEDGRPYNAGQIRMWDPGSGGLPAHVGNEFRALMEHGAMRHLLTVTAVKDHLSYFVVLRRPEVGGALTVYDLLWEEDQGIGDVWENGARKDSRFSDVPGVQFTPGPGDLILFGGGWRWHRVDPLGPASRRVTYGGFAAPSLDGRTLHFWA